MKDYKVHFNNECEYEVISLTHLKDDLYKFESTPLFSEEISFGDIVQLILNGNGVLNFQKIVEKSNYKRYSWMLSRETSESQLLNNLKEQITSTGGHWEQVFGGYFIVYLPFNSSMNLESEMMRVIDNNSL